MSNFPDSFAQAGDESSDSVQNYDVYGGYGESQGFGSVKDSEDVFDSDASIYGNGGGLDGEFGGLGGPILPPQSEMAPEEGFALREWRRQNAAVLEEKEKKEKELLSQIIEEAEQYKVEFYKKREITCENNKINNREKEKLFVTSLEKFYTEADNDYWKAIAELIPREIPTIEKRGKKKDQEKKPSILVVQGPKPGKPTDLTRMRQILLKLKHDSPSHLKHSPPPAPEPTKDANTVSTSASVAAAPKAVVAA